MGSTEEPLGLLPCSVLNEDGERPLPPPPPKLVDGDDEASPSDEPHPPGPPPATVPPLGPPPGPPPGHLAALAANGRNSSERNEEVAAQLADLASAGLGPAASPRSTGAAAAVVEMLSAVVKKQGKQQKSLSSMAAPPPEGGRVKRRRFHFPTEIKEKLEECYVKVPPDGKYGPEVANIAHTLGLDVTRVKCARPSPRSPPQAKRSLSLNLRVSSRKWFDNRRQSERRGPMKRGRSRLGGEANKACRRRVELTGGPVQPGELATLQAEPAAPEPLPEAPPAPAAPAAPETMTTAGATASIA